MTDNESYLPAFPVAMPQDEKGQKVIHYTGLTVRDYFAAKAMQGLLACGPDVVARDGKKLTPFAYEIADAMIEARK